MAAAVDTSGRLVTMTERELDELVERAARRGAELALSAAASSTAAADRLSTRSECAAALGVSLATLDRLAAAGMPRASVRPPRYDVAACREWLTKRDQLEAAQ